MVACKHGGKTKKELEGGEPVAEAAKPEPPTAEAPDISIHEAAWKGNIEAVKQHLAAGTDVDVKGGYSSTADTLTIKLADRTPLHEAASWGHMEIAELLIAKGVDVNAKVASGSKQGLTALDAANETDQTEIADLLRKHGGKTGEELKAEGK